MTDQQTPQPQPADGRETNEATTTQAPTYQVRTYEQLWDALQRFCKGKSVMTVPVDYERDADMILADGIHELVALRATAKHLAGSGAAPTAEQAVAETQYWADRASERDIENLRLRRESELHFRWAYRLLLCLAKRNLADSNAQAAPGEWPAGQEWEELVGSSHSIFLHQAREEAGIPHEVFLERIHSGRVRVTDLYDAAAEGQPLPADGECDQGAGATP